MVGIRQVPSEVEITFCKIQVGVFCGDVSAMYIILKFVKKGSLVACVQVGPLVVSVCKSRRLIVSCFGKGFILIT